MALLAARAAFYDNGAPHWEIGMVFDEDQVNIHGLMLRERQWKRGYDPLLKAHHAQNFALAEAALVESQRREQGKAPQPACPAPRCGALSRDA